MRTKGKDFVEINNAMEKMMQIAHSKKQVNWYKIIIVIAACLAGVIVVAALCYTFIKNSFSLESLLSLMLAFFSIFISVFFYFKTEETSNHFYDMSYDFMKDVSVTLGKIEERFGEKLNHLDDKISNLSLVKEEKTEKLQNVEDEKQRMINELMDKAKFDAKQKEEYNRRYREKEAEADELRLQLQRIENRYGHIITSKEAAIFSSFIEKIMIAFPQKELAIVRNNTFSELPNYLKKKAIEYEIYDNDGDLTLNGRRLLEIIKKYV